jgi:hypothetical protein
MLYRPALNDNWSALSLVRRAIKDKFPTPTVRPTTVFPNRHVFLPKPVYHRMDLNGIFSGRQPRQNVTVLWRFVSSQIFHMLTSFVCPRMIRCVLSTWEVSRLTSSGQFPPFRPLMYLPFWKGRVEVHFYQHDVIFRWQMWTVSL